MSQKSRKKLIQTHTAPADLDPKARAELIASVRATATASFLAALTAEVDRARYKGGTQTQAAYACGLEQSALSNILKKNRLPRFDTVAVVARFLDRSVDSLLGVDSKPTGNEAAHLLYFVLGAQKDRRILYDLLRHEFEDGGEEGPPALPSPEHEHARRVTTPGPLPAMHSSAHAPAPAAVEAVGVAEAVEHNRSGDATKVQRVRKKA